MNSKLLSIKKPSPASGSVQEKVITIINQSYTDLSYPIIFS